MDDSILVSIICTAYNHEKYIRDALEGFVSQITDFKFEVLINDDASIDNTALIIQEYEQKYSDIIKPIYQKENQYSRGTRITKELLVPKARGKYIALCEGDDYWIDKYKLQKQVAYMEKNPGCSFCFTNAECEMNGEIKKKVIPWVSSSVITPDNIYGVDEIEKIGYIPTASFFFKKDDFLKLPTIRSESFQGDGYIKIGLTSMGYGYFIDEPTCVYRFGVEGSATTTWKKNVQKKIVVADKFIKMYEDFDSLFDGKYEIIRKRITEWEIVKLIAQDNYKSLRNAKYRNYYRERGIVQTIKYIVVAYLPIIYKILRK